LRKITIIDGIIRKSTILKVIGRVFREDKNLRPE
jgi:hypothetical protein